MSDNQYSCPKCSAVLRPKNALNPGQKVKCPKCQNVFAPVAEAPPANRFVSIRGARCSRLLELPEDDRAAASLFYIGYQASRLGARTINVGRIPDAEAEALSLCDASPNQTVANAFRRAYLRTLR